MGDDFDGDGSPLLAECSVCPPADDRLFAGAQVEADERRRLTFDVRRFAAGETGLELGCLASHKSMSAMRLLLAVMAGGLPNERFLVTVSPAVLGARYISETLLEFTFE